MNEWIGDLQAKGYDWQRDRKLFRVCGQVVALTMEVRAGMLMTSRRKAPSPYRWLKKSLNCSGSREKVLKRANDWIGKYFKAGPMPKYLADQLEKGNVEITIPGKLIQKGESNGS
jgi:hypothetical protein|tara:strand:+ start:432 stop:776 length:345 start_codon:yes stop_codon:yes gene_type:complete